ncbi:MAG: response regulator [Deltaproteobacteria bacterium]|nr:MAG: response regulator [Deltaproteobacteria bacterium]
MNKLYVTDGPDKGKSFTLGDGITTIGRSSDNDIRISDRGVSRHHAKVLKKNNVLFIIDLNSLGGVFIGGEKIESGLEVEIKEDSKVRIGNTVLSFQERPSAKTAAQPPHPAVQETPFDKSEPLLAKGGARDYVQSLELLLKVSNIFAQSLNINELLGEVIDRIFDLLKRIDRGAILLLNKETGRLQEVVSRTRMERRIGPLSKINYSRTIVHRAIKGGKPVMISDTRSVDKTDLSDSMERMKVGSVMCVPLSYKGDVKGVIYVDSIGLPGGFRKDDLEVLTGLSNTAAIAIENARLYSDLEKLVARRTNQLEKTQDRLQDSESRFRAVFENMSNGVAIFEAIGGGTDFVFKDFNKAAEKIDNIKKEDIINKSVLTVFPGFRDCGLFEILTRVWKTGKPEDHPPMLYRDARVTSWRKGYVYKLPSGEIVFIYEDVTAQKEAVENQQKLQRQLFHAQKMESLGRLAGGVAHNFRNVLQAIMGGSQFLQMAYRKDKQLQTVTRDVNESVKKGSDFVDSLLKFSRQEDEIEMLPLDLKDVLDETYKIISNTFDTRIRIVTKIEGPLPIRGDHSNLNQVFMNLCNNARDSMPDGGELRIKAKRDRQRVIVTISDTGCGIDGETLKNIFDPFYTTKDVGKGTGLGLSITHGIIEEHHGTISVSSQPGKGTVSKVTFPIAEEFDRIESEFPLKIARGKGQKVLIVDDEPGVLRSLGNMVKAIGYDVDSVRSGSQAIEHYKRQKPDLVLLDWRMPQMDGATCAKKILDNDRAARIVVISGYQDAAVNITDRGLKSGIKGLIIKPFDLKKLGGVISKALRS